MTPTATTRAPGGRPRRSAPPRTRIDSRNPWAALWTMMVGFFMILLDSTIVAVANPSIMAELRTGYDTVIWVTSAYLLAFAVPLLVAGRLGDQFGPKNVYLTGLAVFTAASLWCGLSASVGMLVAARVVQGIGAALLTPQTLTTITRIFRPDRRGVAMSVWGATAGMATLVGPLAGGILVDASGWEWIFIVNVPIGVIGLGLAYWLVPALPTHPHRFDLAGVALSGVGMFLIVFALQQGQSAGWAPWIWAVMVAGIGFMVAFVYWQSVNTREPLIPLDIFRDRDFSLSTVGVAVIGFAATAMVLPLMFYAQAACGLSPTRSALLTAPMAITSGLLAPIVGRIVDRAHPRSVIGFGFSILAIALTWLSIEMTPTTPIWRLALPFVTLGVGMAFIWSPLGATATRNLPARLAGAGSGVYNTTRQVGAVLGSASIAAFMTWRITEELPPMPGGLHGEAPDGGALQLPEFLREPFSAAMSQAMLLPAFVALFGVTGAMFMIGFTPSTNTAHAAGRRPAADDRSRLDGLGARTGRIRPMPNISDDFDDYLEYLVPRPPEARPEPVEVNESDTQPLRTRQAPVEHAPVDPPKPEPIGFAHNGFHVDDEQRFRPLTEFASEYRNGYERPPRHGLHGQASPPPRRNRHYRPDPDESAGYGRHSFRDDDY
ncbi:MFS transporter [Mycobacterium shimoidei]|uniref:MFS transporter n=1 Tax=Mycobacterium shimoidei TaxID=29313 RepID=UPI0008491A8A|nr:MFS transporter [Mycobacterium shimoidei]MCV7257448.1 MFS transporter [Mycobacterium shimoidei]ODR13933.1 MFS transporter [Mycobacterium shimoidei]ORW77553.1 MFS transporter [Mycobacterium shimoidei]